MKKKDAIDLNGYFSRNNTLQFLRVTGRIPIWGPLGVGGGYWWYSRKTTYTGFFERQRTQSEWRAFLNFAIGGSQLRPRTVELALQLVG